MLPVSFVQFVHILEHLLKQLLWPRARNILLNSSQYVIVLDARKILLQGDSVNNVRSLNAYHIVVVATGLCMTEKYS